MLRAILLACGLVSTTLASQVVVGKVINSATGAAIPGVRVRLFPAGNSPGGGYSAITDVDGRFQIEGVDEGIYRPLYAAPGFSSLPTPGNILPAFVVASGSDPVRLDEVKMQPLAKLSGRVLDVLRKPVPSATVWLIQGKRWCPPPSCFLDHRTLTTNEKGEYAATDVVPGAWLLSASAPSSWNPPAQRGEERLGWAETFYPGVIDPQLAEPVTVQGSEQRNPDLTLMAVPVHRVRGRVLDMRGNPVPEVSVVMGKSSGPSLTQKTEKDGAFEFSSVVAAEWRLSATAEKNGVKLKATYWIDLKDHDLENIELQLMAPFTIQGKILMKAPEGAVALQPPPIDLVLMSGAPLLSEGAGAFTPIRLDGGELTVADVYPGVYEIRPLSESPTPYYLDSIRLGDQEGLGAVTILSGAQPLTVTYQIGGGTVVGNFKACGTARIILLPQDPALRQPGFLRVADCGQNGRFEIQAVRPGKYFGFAAEGTVGSFGALFKDEEVLKKASAVAVHANESSSIEIRSIER